ncbi:hypothetical protein J32TS6_22420 [Virgibacillus pantothenticus]|nr:hypothetical protein J32TS6_22420 [Virgibacillus pantothenticus]SIS72835.1 hypothetical protein SAMN05421787_102452 [Virgibacillus pantothenticus]
MSLNDFLAVEPSTLNDCRKSYRWLELPNQLNRSFFVADDAMSFVILVSLVVSSYRARF